MPEKFDKMRKKIKQGLLADGVPEKEAERRSYAIATAQWKKSHGGKAPSRESYIDESGKKRDEHGRYVVAENVTIKLNGTIDTIIEG